MLDGSSPQAGKIWKKALLTFTYNGKKMMETFLICNTGGHVAILGLKWLDAHNPEIDWNQCTVTFPHMPPEHVAIVKSCVSVKANNYHRDLTVLKGKARKG
ncbi:hypothetical protein RhiTH_011628 [Rhizoctonia solani]